jgi:hypothetical protein
LRFATDPGFLGFLYFAEFPGGGSKVLLGIEHADTTVHKETSGVALAGVYLFVDGIRI